MARDSYGPRFNPCAQCGKPIFKPAWTEEEDDRVSYLWSCSECGYEFTVIAVFGDRRLREHPLAA